MNDKNVRLEDRANRVQTFGIENTTDFAAGGKANGLLRSPFAFSDWPPTPRPTSRLIQ